MRFRTTIIAVLGIACLAGCTTRSDVAWQPDGQPAHDHPHQDWWNYQFVYDHTQQIYHEPYSGQYWWYDNGRWMTAEALPYPMKMDPRTCRVVKGAQPTPPFHHSTFFTVAGPTYEQHPDGTVVVEEIEMEMVQLSEF